MTIKWLTAHSVWTCQRWPMLKSPLKNVLNVDFLTDSGVFGLWISSVEWAVFFTNISSFFQGQNKNLFLGGSAFTVDRAGLRLAASNTYSALRCWAMICTDPESREQYKYAPYAGNFKILNEIPYFRQFKHFSCVIWFVSNYFLNVINILIPLIRKLKSCKFFLRQWIGFKAHVSLFLFWPWP